MIECFEVTEADGPGEDEDLPDADDDADRRRAAGLARPAPPPAAFAQRALAVVAAGRPPCPFCGKPLDPSGHVCPRANGYRR